MFLAKAEGKKPALPPPLKRRGLRRVQILSKLGFSSFLAKECKKYLTFSKLYITICYL
jgi:hypothetical protein